MAAMQVWGTVNGDGTIASGTGFTVTKTGAGEYVITFNAKFENQPAPTTTLYGATRSGLTRSSAASRRNRSRSPRETPRTTRTTGRSRSL